MKYLKYIIIIVLFLVPFKSGASDSKIVIWFNDGNTIEVFFDDYPMFVFKEGVFALKDNQTELSWSFSLLKKFTIENVSTTETNIHKISTENTNIILDSCDVYDLNGKLLSKKHRSLSELPRGVYIVKKGIVMTKVVKK